MKRLTLVLITSLFLWSPSVYAYKKINPPTNGLSVSPAIVNLKLAKNQDNAPFSLEVSNNYPYGVSVKMGAVDFTSLNQTGGVSFLNQETALNTNSHGLASSISSQASNLYLASKTKSVVLFSVNHVNQLAFGGHYAAITFNVTPESIKGANKVGIGQTVVSLVFVSTAGEGTQTTDLDTPLISPIVFSIPSTIYLGVSNNGNTQTVPRGILQFIHNNKVIVQSQLNTTSSQILPDTKRIFELPIPNNVRSLIPEAYVLKVVYRHDGQSAYRTYSQKFIYIPSFYLAILFIELIPVLYYMSKEEKYTKYFINRSGK